MSIECHVFRQAPYDRILEIQTAEFAKRVECRKTGLSLPDDVIFFVEHLPVLTLGKHGNSENLVVDKVSLEARGIGLFHIGRGGDITYHGPGQLTVYPIIDLIRYRMGVREYVSLLEEAVILTIKDYGIEGKRIEGATGVWIGDAPGERKISAIGVRCSRSVTMHGLALNIGPDLSGFSLINPCGFKDKGVTSISNEIGEVVDFEEVVEKLKENLIRLLLQRIPSPENF